MEALSPCSIKHNCTVPSPTPQHNIQGRFILTLIGCETPFCTGSATGTKELQQTALAVGACAKHVVARRRGDDRRLITGILQRPHKIFNSPGTHNLTICG
jgi:hypothetical protein